MIRARFYVKFKDCNDDYRPVKWPIKYPYWCTGENSDSFIIVAYAENKEQIMELWPEAFDIQIEDVKEIVFTTRFPKPKWYKEETK